MRYAGGVSESFVDLTYRGLPLGRRIKLTQVRPSTGYLELAAPMPVGSRLAITAEDGGAIEAVVAQIYEQAAADRAPGMLIAPVLEEGAAAWWRARVTLPELPPKPAPIVRAPAPPPEAEPPPPPEVEATLVVDEPPLADDGKRTVAMDAVDLSALGLEAGTSGQLLASRDDESAE